MLDGFMRDAFEGRKLDDPTKFWVELPDRKIGFELDHRSEQKPPQAIAQSGT
jgi:hypothetical protein